MIIAHKRYALAGLAFDAIKEKRGREGESSV